MVGSCEESGRDQYVNGSPGPSLPELIVSRSSPVMINYYFDAPHRAIETAVTIFPCGARLGGQYAEGARVCREPKSKSSPPEDYSVLADRNLSVPCNEACVAGPYAGTTVLIHTLLLNPLGYKK